MARRFSSPNPPSSRPQINHHLKTPEHGFGVSGYRNPSDIPQRMSGGAKENDNRESRSLHRSRSQGKHSSVTKGNRSFMAPTISASSKVISSYSSSSKRRILSERNEAPQTINRESYSLISGSDSEMCSGCQNFPDKKPVQITHIASPPPPELPIIAPLDADPSPAAAPPYDVERNFLSPRPQFLHYKPNPRIQLYLNNKQQHLFDQFPDDSLSSESCDDVEEDVDSILSGSHEFLQEEKVPEPAEKEEEEEEEVKEEEEEEETDTPVTNSRIRSLHKPRILPVIFMMIAACFLFPAIDTPVIFRKESPLPPPSSPYPEFLSRITEFATSRPRTEEGNVGTFSVHYGFLNSTIVQEEQSFLGFPAAMKESDADVEVAVYHEKEIQPENIDIPVEEEQDSKEVTTEEASAEALVEASDDPTTAEPNLQSDLEPSNNDQNRQSASELNSDHVEKEMEQQVHEEEGRSNNDGDSEVRLDEDEAEPNLQSELEPELEPELNSDHVEKEMEQVHEEEDRSNNDGDSEVRFDEDEAKTTPSTAATTTTLPTKSTMIVGVSSVIVALAAVLLSLYLLARKKKKEKEKEEMASSMSDGIRKVFVSDQTRQPDQSGSSMSISIHDQPFDAVEKNTNESGGGGSSEMSSTTNYHETSIGGESFSFERVGGSVGDSAASSASYGSFTTYEKLSAKRRTMDEALTPVRRSSRIRSKVSSPILKT